MIGCFGRNSALVKLAEIGFFVELYVYVYVYIYIIYTYIYIYILYFKIIMFEFK